MPRTLGQAAGFVLGFWLALALSPLARGEGFGGEGLGVEVDQPGRYRFEGFEVSGFEPVPSLIIEAVDGETVEHVIQLVRKQ